MHSPLTLRPWFICSRETWEIRAKAIWQLVETLKSNREALKPKQEALKSEQEALKLKQEALKSKQEAPKSKRDTSNQTQEAFKLKDKACNCAD